MFTEHYSKFYSKSVNFYYKSVEFTIKLVKYYKKLVNFFIQVGVKKFSVIRNLENIFQIIIIFACMKSFVIFR